MMLKRLFFFASPSTPFAGLLLRYFLHRLWRCHFHRVAFALGSGHSPVAVATVGRVAQISPVTHTVIENARAHTQDSIWPVTVCCWQFLHRSSLSVCVNSAFLHWPRARPLSLRLVCIYIYLYVFICRCIYLDRPVIGRLVAAEAANSGPPHPCRTLKRQQKNLLFG